MEDVLNQMLKARTELQQAFNSYSVILFLGRKTKIENMPKILKRLPFKCILSTKDYGTISTFFLESGYREPLEVGKKDDFKLREVNLFDAYNTPIVYLNGNVDSEDEDLFDAQDNMLDLLGFIFEKSNINQMFVIYGYDELDEQDINVKKFCSKLLTFHGKIMSFIPDGINKIWENKLTTLNNYTIDLFEVFSDDANVSDDEMFLGDASDDVSKYIFYKNKKVCAIDEEVYRHFRHYGQLLNTEIEKNRPLGRVNRKIWFTNFISLSYAEPQWYGYDKNVNFYVKRAYEKNLYALVKNLLSSGNMIRKQRNVPIILQGPPASSKSIELAAVAYKIYMEKEFPVIFINRDDLILNAGMYEFNKLKELMLEIDRQGDNEKKIFLVWDCSAYHNIVNRVDTLINDLDNLGRKFVLLCSGYDNAVFIDDNCEYYSLEENGVEFQREYDKNLDNLVTYCNGYYVLLARRTMNEHEFYESEKLIHEFANKESVIYNQLKEWRNSCHEYKKDIFYFYFTLYRILRPALRSRLSKEQYEVLDFVQKKMDEFAGSNTMDESPLAIALREAKEKGLLSIKDDGMDDIEEGSHQQVAPEFKQAVEKFCNAVALFSRFKMKMPADYGLKLLGGEAYWNNVGDLMAILHELTYIVYDDNVEANFSFSFRLPLEAEIYIKMNRNFSPQNQVKILCELIRWVGENYYALPINNIEQIQSLLRLMGPNTVYDAFKRNGDLYKEHKKIIENYDQIINSLQELRDMQHIPDDDASFVYNEVTFIREYYGNYFQQKLCVNGDRKLDVEQNEVYLKHISMLEKAIRLSDKYVSELQKKLKDEHDRRYKKRLVDNMNGLVVEMCQCNYHLLKILQDYKEYCNQNGITANFKKIETGTMSYQEQKEQLLSVLHMSPANGYAYNQLFKTFSYYYDNDRLETDQEKTRSLLEMINICDVCCTQNITQRGSEGKDELGINLSKIMGYLNKYEVSIEAVRNRSASETFMQFFDRFVEDHRFACIYFVCQKELQNAHIDNMSIRKWMLQQHGEPMKLNFAQKAVCKKIIRFMNEYPQCIENSKEALHFMLRVFWMAHNGYSFAFSENKHTYISKDEEWQTIDSICDKCRSLYNEANQRIPHDIILLQCLAITHLKGLKSGTSFLRMWHEDNISWQVPRMRTPYLICDGNGTPILYSGTVSSLTEGNTRAKIHIEGEDYDFSVRNTSKRSRLKKNSVQKNLILGVGYVRISVRDIDGGVREEMVGL